jgi:hypothetical protein
MKCSLKILICGGYVGVMPEGRERLTILCLDQNEKADLSARLLENLLNLLLIAI